MNETLEKPWIKNAPSLIVVNSIFATLAGVLLAFVLQDHCLTKLFPCVWLFAMSFFLFALTSEGITTAIDEDDVRRYVFLMIPYNIGVILLLVGVAVLIYYKCEFSKNLCLTVTVTLLFTMCPWGKDLCFLCNPVNKNEFKTYIEELEGRKIPIKKPGWLARFYFWIKGI